MMKCTKCGTNGDHYCPADVCGPDVGVIDPEWGANMIENSHDLNELLCQHLNAADADIDENGNAWTGSRWLTQDEVDAFVAACERGM